MNKKICAVVVTYNRLALLQECITSLRNQTRLLDEIIIVNNDSKDGTKKWLNEQKDLKVIHQGNLGGAGGFHTGIKTAYESGYDWIWCMDDDGLPLNNALEELVKYESTGAEVLNSIVVSKSNPVELVFGLEDYVENKYFASLLQIAHLTSVCGANFFNGTLISRDVVTKVGLPNTIFFIYGDELEYYFRIIEKCISIKTIPASIMKHPMQKHIYVGKWKFFYRINYFNALGVKYVPRNLMALCYLYDEYTFRRLIKSYIYDLIGILFIQRNLFYCMQYIKSIISGISFINKIKNE